MANQQPTTAQVRGVLERTAERIRKGWTQGAWSRNKTGAPLGLGNTHATCWCLTAALRIESDAPTLALWHAALRACYRSISKARGIVVQRAETPGGMELALQQWQDGEFCTVSDVLKGVEDAAAGLR